MDDLAAFLNARFDEVEGEARAAQEVRSDYHAWHSAEDLRVQGMDDRDALHIAAHSPAQVLADVDSSRRIMWEHRPLRRRVTGSTGGTVADCQRCSQFPAQYPCLTLRLLALRYASHPDYRQEWRP